MTITSLPVRDEYTATAGQTVFNYTFKIYTNQDLNVYITPSGQDADDSADLTTAYTVDSATIGNESGGFITLSSGANSGDLVTIVSDIVEDRTTDYQNSGDFLPDTVNTDFDRVVSLVKQIDDRSGRTLAFPESLQNASSLSLPNPSSGLFLKWKSDLSGLENTGAPAVIIDGTNVGVVSAMIADTSLIVGDFVTTAGYSSSGDGGNNSYEIVAAATGTDDGGSFIDLANGLQAKGLFPGGFRNIKQWGAFGDGLTDDTTAVLAAVAAMTSQSALYVPSGIYIVNATLDFTAKNFITFYGDGWGASIIKRTDGTFGDTTLFSRTTPATQQAVGITLRDIQFYCAADMDSGAVVHIKNTTRFIYENVFIRNCHIGIHLEGIRDSRFDNLEIISNEHFTVNRAGSCHLLVGPPTDSTKESTETFFSNFNFTTAGSGVSSQEDLTNSIVIDGALDGLWFSDGHTFGGKTSNLLIDGDGHAELQGLTFDHVWFDQFTPRNMIIQGVAVDKFRLITFDGCRFWGGSTNCISIDSSSNIQDVTFEGCEIGVTQGQGFQIGAGQVLIKGATFKAINQAVAANGYALQSVSSSNVNTIITVLDSEFECSALSYGIQCVDTAIEYHFQGNCFRGQDVNMLQEILFSANALNGTCSGNTTGRVASGDVTAVASTNLNNIAVNDYNLQGGATNIDDIYPTWHGRRVTLKADTAIQTLTNAGNIRNKAGGAANAIPISDVVLYEYRGDTARWHEL